MPETAQPHATAPTRTAVAAAARGGAATQEEGEEDEQQEQEREERSVRLTGQQQPGTGAPCCTTH